MDDPAEKPDHYEYYLLGQLTPVRVAFDKAGRKMGAEVPDAASASGFRHDHTYLTRLREADQVEAIDEAAFEKRARVYSQTQNKPKPSR